MASPAVSVSSYHHLPEVIRQADAVVSILGRADKLAFPEVGARPTLRLAFDDIQYSTSGWMAPSQQHIADLIGFARDWAGYGTLCVHCRAGSSRSPAAAMIAVAALGRSDAAELVLRVRTAKAYYKPHERMLQIADGLLGNNPGLVDLARSVPMPTRQDDWGPARISLRP